MRSGIRLATLASIVFLMNGCDRSPKDIVPAAPAPFHAKAELPSGRLDRRNLIEYAMVVRDYEPEDDFVPQTFNDGTLMGRQFRVDVDMADPQNADIEKIFSYDLDDKVLNLSLLPGTIDIFRKTTELPSEERYNAFGATVAVKRKEIEIFSVGPIRDWYNFGQSNVPKEIGIFKFEKQYTDLYGDKKYSFSSLEKVIPMAPEKAREVSRSIHLVIEGVVTKDYNGNSVKCSRDIRSKATINYPFENIYNECTVSARFTRIQVSSPKAGILASWE